MFHGGLFSSCGFWNLHNSCRLNLEKGTQVYIHPFCQEMFGQIITFPENQNKISGWQIITFPDCPCSYENNIHKVARIMMIWGSHFYYYFTTIFAVIFFQYVPSYAEDKLSLKLKNLPSVLFPWKKITFWNGTDDHIQGFQ